MNLNFADTLYFKKENILEIILGLHRSYKYLQREIQTCCELNNLTFNELLVLLEIKKGFKKKIDIVGFNGSKIDLDISGNYLHV